MAKKKMLLFVWKSVGCDYTCGIAVAAATSVEEARKVILDRIKESWEKESIGRDIAEVPDEILALPAGHYCYGGG